jgi:hypothetical protein
MNEVLTFSIATFSSVAEVCGRDAFGGAAKKSGMSVVGCATTTVCTTLIER